MPDKHPDDALLTPREVAELFGVRTTTIARWAREGTLTSLRTPGGHRRYRREELQRLLDEGGTPPDPATQHLAEEAARLYARGWSIRQIAEKFDHSYGAMRRILLKHVTLRRRGANPVSTAKTDSGYSGGWR